MNKVFKILLIIGLIGVAHVTSPEAPFGQNDSELSENWANFSEAFGVSEYGVDGYFVRAVRNGHAIFHNTANHAWRFTRRTRSHRINACASCHTPTALAYAFVNSDRFDRRLNKRVSFEERIMRCYVMRLDGFVPTIYDPAVRDLRIFARVVAHRNQLTEGQLPAEPFQ